MASHPTTWSGPSDDWCWEHNSPCVAWDDDEDETPLYCEVATEDGSSDCNFEWQIDAAGNMIVPSWAKDSDGNYIKSSRTAKTFYRRKCKVCGRGMNSGYLGDWDTYCSEECARKDITNFDELIERAEEDDDAPLYWTDWEEDDEESDEVGFWGDAEGWPIQKESGMTSTASWTENDIAYYPREILGPNFVGHYYPDWKDGWGGGTWDDILAMIPSADDKDISVYNPRPTKRLFEVAIYPGTKDTADMTGDAEMFVAVFAETIVRGLMFDYDGITIDYEMTASGTTELLRETEKAVATIEGA